MKREGRKSSLAVFYCQFRNLFKGIFSIFFCNSNCFSLSLQDETSNNSYEVFAKHYGKNNLGLNIWVANLS